MRAESAHRPTAGRPCRRRRRRRRHKECAGSNRARKGDLDVPLRIARGRRTYENASARAVQVILPVTEATAYLLARNRGRLAQALVPLPDADSWDFLSDKCRLLQTAQQLQVPAPTTLFPDTADELVAAVEQLGHPAVLKPCRSKVWSQDRCTTTAVHVAHARAELGSLTAAHSYLRDFPLAVHAYVPGSGLGVFALYDHGKPVTFFAHRRIRGKPPCGGVSALSESIACRHSDLGHPSSQPCPLARSCNNGIPRQKGWNPAVDGDQPAVLGLPQLAIDASVDFPGLLYELALGRVPVAPQSYRTGISVAGGSLEISTTYTWYSGTATWADPIHPGCVKFCDS